MWQRFTIRARQAIFFAQEEAARFGGRLVGPEHLLLGLLRDRDFIAYRILEQAGIAPETLRDEVERRCSRLADVGSDEMQLTPRAARVVDLAFEEARRLTGNYIGTEHLLVGLLREEDSAAARAMVEQGATLDDVRRILDRMQEGGPEVFSRPPANRDSTVRRDANAPAAGAAAGTAADSPVAGSGPKPSDWQVITEEARCVVFFAQAEAAWLKQDHVDTEHVLLGIVREYECAGARILRDLGVGMGRLRVQLHHKSPRGTLDGDEDRELTAAVKQVVAAAREQAAYLGDEKVGSEHLLLGLLLEGNGLAAQVLSSEGVDAERVLAARQSLREETPGPRPDPPAPKGIGAVRGLERTSAPMWQRFTERARRVVFFAQEESARLGENYVGTEHLLLGLTREGDNVAARVLDRLGVPLGRIRADIERQASRGHGKLGQDMQLTPRAKRVIDLAYEEARELNNNYIGTEHLLLGLIREGDGLGARVLAKQGASLERVREVVHSMQEGRAHDAEGMPRLTATAAGLATRMRMLRSEMEYVESQVQALEVEQPHVAGHGEPTEPEVALHALRGVSEQVGKSDEEIPNASMAAISAVACAKGLAPGLRHLLSVRDLEPAAAEGLIHLARILKRTLPNGRSGQGAILRGKSVALVFEKPSLRTRVSNEAGIFQLGGQPIYLGPSDIRMGERESVPDVARNLERWVDGIVARVFSHQTLVELAAHSRVPVINALSDLEHPCQAIADFLTLLERRGKLAGLHVAYIGDGNNVAHSLALMGAKLGVSVTVACPEGYEPLPEVMEAARAEAEQTGARVAVVRDPLAAAAGADALYTDVWTSMGQEEEAEERRRIFCDYQISEALLAAAAPEAIVLHCLPAHRGEEIAPEVIDGPRSAVFDQAENRLHAHKAVLAALL